METQKTPNSQSSLEKEEELEKSTFLTSDYTTKLVIRTVWYWHKNKYRPVEQDRKPRNKLMHLWVSYF